MAASLIRVKIPRRFQPQDSFDLAAEIRGYASSVMLGSAFGQTIDGRPITYGGGLVPGPSAQGWAYQGDGTDNIAYATPVRPFVFGTDKDFTFVVVARKRTSGIDSNTIAGFGSTGGSSGNTLFRLIGGASSANAVRMQAQDASGDVFLNTDTSDFGWDDLAYHAIVIKGRIAHASTDGGVHFNFCDGKPAGSATGLSATTPDATTFNHISAAGARRGGSSIGFGPYDVALFLPLIGVQMPDDWCLRASRLGSVWQACFEPRRVWVPVSTAAAGSHDTSGALASDAASIAGTAAHLALHSASGALAADAGAVAGTAAHLTLHATSGALAADAATISGAADHAAGSEHTTEGALSSDAAVIAGTAAHYTLRATTGELAADAATIAGTAAHLTLHTASGALAADPASMAGAAVHSGAGATVPAPQGGGRSKPQSKPRRRVIEIDGEDFVVASTEEAQALLERLQAEAEAKAAQAIQRANSAQRRPTRKVLRDARLALQAPQIQAESDLADYAARVQQAIADLYRQAMVTVEVSALLAKQQREEEDDEDVLLLIA